MPNLQSPPTLRSRMHKTMSRSDWLNTAAVILFLTCLTPVASAQSFNVKIVNRQSSETERDYVVPAHYSSWSNANVNCTGNSTNVNCNGSASSSGFGTPAQLVSFHVTGATFSLLLPDGRVAVVNCESKFAERFAGPRGNRRSCRVPLVDDIQAEFKGKNAKLRWLVSIDGKTFESETYRIVAVLDK